jgi:LmbE family N-acetylglucosaminyl deacetylase
MAVDVLAIGAHMGDEVAWGMTLAAHRRQGMRVGMFHLTPGEKGHPTMAPDAYAAQKREEAQACADVLGAEIWTLDYKDGELPINDEVKLQVARVIREARPKTIITHWRGSMHKDHTAVHELLPDARFYAGIAGFDLGAEAHWTPKAYFAENWEDLKGFVPEIFVEILPEDMEVWERAMRCYALFRGGVSKFPYLDYYHAQCRARGAEVMCGLAASFAVPPEQHRRKTASLVG